jgi:hypothetical protein
MLIRKVSLAALTLLIAGTLAAQSTEAAMLSIDCIHPKEVVLEPLPPMDETIDPSPAISDI